MARRTLAVKYRPKTFDDVVEQDNIRIILEQQLANNDVKNAYLFVGGAGTGKTTCARIFANEINKGNGNPIELDAASNNGVDDVRDIIKQAQSQSLDSEYKVFIIDECHMITNAGWNAMLKLIEEPPAKSIFIFCTTNPEKIPKTILSRVQRYDFRRISQNGICDRLASILRQENVESFDNEAIEYLAKLADGGMRDAITLLDKSLSYSTQLTIENVVNALGTISYDTMFNLLWDILACDWKAAIEQIENFHDSGKDLKQFTKDFLIFLVDVTKYGLGVDFKYLSIPRLGNYEKKLEEIRDEEYADIDNLLNKWLRLNYEIKYSATPKADIEATIVTVTNLWRVLK